MKPALIAIAALLLLQWLVVLTVGVGWLISVALSHHRGISALAEAVSLLLKSSP